MKIALVHDYLNQIGGAERVLAVLAEMFPKAPIYTLLYDKKKMRGMFSDRDIKTSFLDFQFVRNHHRLFIPLMPHAIRTMHLADKFDLIISDSAGFAKGIPHDRNTKHLSYCHTPLRYVWETDTYFNGGFRHGVFKSTFKPLFSYVKKFDYRFAQYPDVLLANSHFIADKVREYYHRNAAVLYPPVDLRKFYPDSTTTYNLPPTTYFLAVGRFLPYKKFDLIIDTFNKNNLPLIIVGGGREEMNLKKQATSKNITFLPYQDDIKLRELYNGAKALLFPQVEDFGLVAAEAHACGTPVIAFDGGGAHEIVQDGVTGVLFNEQSVSGLSAAIQRFETYTFNQRAISETAQRFSKENFEKGIMDAIKQLMNLQTTY
ncbi:MAG: glycosyltransferase [bacterium]|nr:glycosyltransferase [bacterium]